MFDIYELFDSIGIIVDSKLKELALDRTIICTIVDDTECTKGNYTVEYNSTTFTANSSNFSLEKGDLVYVGVPQNDFTNAYIISKKILGLSAQTATLPFANFIEEFKIDLLSNYRINLAATNLLTWENGLKYYPFNNPNKFKQLGLSCSVYAKTNNLDLTKDYGVRIYIKSQRTINEQTQQYTNIINFNINQLLNPIGYNTAGEQLVEELFDISDIDNITELRAEIYGGYTLTNLDDEVIQIKNLSLLFGNDISDYKTEGVTLYTNDGLVYEGNNNETKTIYAKWVYKENAQIKVVTPFTPANERPVNATIEWMNSIAKNQWVFEYSDFNKYFASKTIDAVVKYNSIETDTILEYPASITFTNNNKNDLSVFSAAAANAKLIAKTANFRNVYNSDGTIIDKVLMRDKQNYMLSLSQPIFKSQNQDNHISIKAQISIPSTRCNLLFDDYKIYGFTLQSDVTKAFVYEKDITNFIDSHDILMPFNIKPYYKPDQINNTITCTYVVYYDNELLENKSYDLSIDFSRSGVCKTDYVLFPTITDVSGNETSFLQIENGVLNISMALYNAEGKELPIENPITWSWYGRSSIEAENAKTSQNIYCSIIGKNSCRLSSHLVSEYVDSEDYNYVLLAQYKTYKEESKVLTQVECYIPIAINCSQDTEDSTRYIIKDMEGPTTVVYGIAGGEPSFYQTEYQLFDENDLEVIDVKWTNSVENVERENTLPYIYKNNGKYYLHAPMIYIKDQYTRKNVLLASKNDKVIWIQPIVTYQTKSFSSIINDWDGTSIELNQDTGTALAPAIGAGKKNEDNSFSGVFLGDFTKFVEGEENQVETLTGVYGMQNNELTYGFREDGTAFLGKDGAGQIAFNGNHGLIYSGNCDITLIDLSKEYVNVAQGNDQEELQTMLYNSFSNAWSLDEVQLNPNPDKPGRNFIFKNEGYEYTLLDQKHFSYEGGYRYKIKLPIIKNTSMTKYCNVKFKGQFYNDSGSAQQQEINLFRGFSLITRCDTSQLERQITTHYYKSNPRKQNEWTTVTNAKFDEDAGDWFTSTSNPQTFDFSLLESIEIKPNVSYELTIDIVPSGYKSLYSIITDSTATISSQPAFYFCIQDFTISISNDSQDSQQDEYIPYNPITLQEYGTLSDINNVDILSYGKFGTLIDLLDGNLIINQGIIRENVQVLGSLQSNEVIYGTSKDLQNNNGVLYELGAARVANITQNWFDNSNNTDLYGQFVGMGRGVYADSYSIGMRMYGMVNYAYESQGEGKPGDPAGMFLGSLPIYFDQFDQPHCQIKPGAPITDLIPVIQSPFIRMNDNELIICTGAAADGNDNNTKKSVYKFASNGHLQIQTYIWNSGTQTWDKETTN